MSSKTTKPSKKTPKTKTSSSATTDTSASAAAQSKQPLINEPSPPLQTQDGAVSSGEKAAALFLTIFVAFTAIYLFATQEFTQLTPQFNLPSLNLLAENAFGGALNKVQREHKQFLKQQEEALKSHSLDTQDYSHIYSSDMSAQRAIRKVFLAIEQAEGQGARVRRSIGTPNLRNFSPFLMLDHFSIKPGAGFPDHPHRGQETITYLLQGAVDHEDFAGNKGTINSGDLQFMTAGKGIVHAEMPRQNADGSANVGLQLWVDLPEKLKFCEPRYRDLRAAEIPKAEVDDGKATIKVISGQSHGIDSVKDLAYTPVWILDIQLRPGGKVSQPLPKNWNAFSYILEGSAYYGKGDSRQKVDQYHNVVFDQEGDEVTVEAPADAKEDTRLVIIAGTPLDQQVVQYGPFVLNNKEQVHQALYDYQTFANGFERAKDWESEIGKTMKH